MMTEQNKDLTHDVDARDGREQGQVKKNYAKPQLIIHGSVEQLTQGLSSGLQEGETGTSTSGNL
jgi:hypothetical protein